MGGSGAGGAVAGAGAAAGGAVSASGAPDAGGTTGAAGASDAAGAPDAGASGEPCVAGAACDDRNACTQGESCDATGACTGGAALNCDDSDPCTADSCNPTSGCVHVERDRCGEPNCSLGACAGPDTDGDGFSDAVEDADYIDLNCNGEHDAADFDFPHRAQPIFSKVTQVGSGAGVLVPTVTDSTLPVATSTIVVTVASSGSVGAATVSYSIDGGASSEPVEARPVLDISGNVRLIFYQPDTGFALGDTYTFTTEMGASEKVADKNLPNVYVQYDYMDFAAPGAACTADQDCDELGFELNDVCHLGACNHNHYPNDPLARPVVDAYAAHGITLYIDPVHHAIPHAEVVTFSKAGTPGGVRACAGHDVVAGDITTGGAVNFQDIKNRTGYGGPFDPKRAGVFRYAVMGHYNTCFQGSPADGYCGACPGDRTPENGSPQPGAMGTSELPGNDFIISLGGYLNNAGGSNPNDPFVQSGIFMHELGHTLGLQHFGDQPSPVSPPNYLSVMNYDYAFLGIQHASTPGSVVAVEALHEIDYSEHVLGTLNEPQLVEADGVSPLSSGYTGILYFYDTNASYSPAPESGPIDWSGSGVIDTAPVSADLNLADGATEVMRGYRDWDHPAVNGGACSTNADCRVNYTRQLLSTDGVSIDPHEPCVGGVCQSLIYDFQCMPWGAD